ncbi:V-type proton ATPase subunit G-like [Homarus americanus]|uniref:V-type proton ATPase subunit G n=1 Tax=Homarus americanus TaxID=6706 RepID=A0A8J5JU31_HOMAM|nr:V-type proton ATPase subunit G-like [Homarus americanus]KAG7164266.1 V-type proton ATPase subunit G-like [Homarus americanus]
MASQSQGVQQLLAAEKKAAERVAEARKRKARRLKQAKDEAQAEIEKFRQERDRQFKEYETKHLGSQDDIALKIKKDTVEKITAMNKQVAANKDKVIVRIMQLVKEIKPELHINAKKEM